MNTLQLGYGIKTTQNSEDDGNVRIGTLEAVIENVSLYDSSNSQVDRINRDEPFRIDIEYKINNDEIEDMILLLSVLDSHSINCFETHIHSVKNTFGILKKSGEVSCSLPNINLLPGCYNIIVGLYPTNWEVTYDYHWNMHEFYVEGNDSYPHFRSGVLALTPQWSVKDSNQD